MLRVADGRRNPLQLQILAKNWPDERRANGSVIAARLLFGSRGAYCTAFVRSSLCVVVETRGSNDFRPLFLIYFRQVVFVIFPAFHSSFVVSWIFRDSFKSPEAECCVRLQRRVVVPLQCWEAALCSAGRSSEPSQRRRRLVSSRSFSWTSMLFSQVFRKSCSYSIWRN